MRASFPHGLSLAALLVACGGTSSTTPNLDAGDTDTGAVADDRPLGPDLGTLVDTGQVDVASSDLGPDDAGPPDVGSPDIGAAVDTGPDDVGVLDTGPADTGPADTGPMDTGPADTGPADVGPADTGPVDSGPADTGPADTGPMDTSPADTGPPDAGPADAGPADTGPADTGPPDVGPVDAGPQCTPTQSVCGGTCVETRVNSQHCGGCGQRCCAANVCTNGTCNLACAPGNTACQIAPRGPDGCYNVAVCADLRTDRQHCGRCGVDCGADGFCVEGRCAQRTPDGAWIAPEQGASAGAFEVVASNLGGVQGLLFTRDARSAYVSATGNGVIWRVDLSETPVRTVRWAESLVGPSQMTFDPEGRIVVAEREGNRVTRIVVNPDGTAGARTPYAAAFQGPWGVVFDHAGRLLVSNEFGTTVDRIGVDGMVQRAVVPAFAVPLELRFDAQRNLFVGDYGSPLTSGTRVLVYGPDLTLARTLTGFAGPIGIALDGGGNVYVANYRGNNVTRVTPSGAASTYGAGLNGPHAIAFDPQGRLYVADYGAGRLVRFPATR